MAIGMISLLFAYLVDSEDLFAQTVFVLPCGVSIAVALTVLLSSLIGDF
jgi:hypothetical protein